MFYRNIISILFLLSFSGCSTSSQPSPTFQKESAKIITSSAKATISEEAVINIGVIDENGVSIEGFLNKDISNTSMDGVVKISMNFEEDIAFSEESNVSIPKKKKQKNIGLLSEQNTSVVFNPKKEKRSSVKRIKFPISEYKRLPSSGEGIINGSVFVELKGVHISQSKVRLYLNPKTSYSDQWYNETYLKGKRLGKADKRLFRYLKFTVSNKNGEFAFFDIPDGKYYVIANISCGKECGFSSSRFFSVAKAVHLEDGKNITLSVDLAVVVE